ncbi:MAG: MBL fold metallo-hydrolase [Planctomycetes bacterium]|nr:MBL fold metallo-hydrolase [Planctomycetota bacterium]
MFLHQRFVPGLAIYSYVIGDEKSGVAAVLDPTRDVGEYVRVAEAAGLRIAHILETHVHADYISGAKELKARLGGAPTIHASKLGGPEWTPAYVDRAVGDSDEIVLGSLRLKVVHTPGHTPEHIGWELFDDTRSKDTPWLFFSGDFLFVGDVGRPDLLGEEARKKLAVQLYDSVFTRLPKLPEFTEVYPAHGAGSLCGKALAARGTSTVGFERRFNPSLAERGQAEWIEMLMRGMPPSPPYFARMKRVNREGPAVLGGDCPALPGLAPADFESKAKGGALLVDVRGKEAFAAAHVPGSVNIPGGPSLPTWAGWVLPYDKPLLLVAENNEKAREAALHLWRVGYDSLAGFLAGSLDAWVLSGRGVEALPAISVQDLRAKLEGKAPVTVLDVRTEGEFTGGHVAGAVLAHAGMVREKLGLLPKDKAATIAVMCGSGYRAAVAASVLRREGYKNATLVHGGMGAWTAAGYPAVKD